MTLEELYKKTNPNSKKTILESSLSRLYRYWSKYDTGTISAYREAPKCNSANEVPYTKRENEDRNHKLKAKLLLLGYEITPIKGGWVYGYETDNPKDQKENSFFVVDRNNIGQLKKDLLILGQKYDQDSITYANKGEPYYLISTNSCKNGYPGEGKIGVEVILGKPKYGEKEEFFSAVNGRPFIFTECLRPLHISKYHPTEIRSIKTLAESPLKR